MSEQRQIPKGTIIGTIIVFVAMALGTCILVLFLFNLPVIFPPPSRNLQAIGPITLEPTLSPPAGESTITLPPTEPPTATPTFVFGALPPITLSPTNVPPPTIPPPPPTPIPPPPTPLPPPPATPAPTDTPAPTPMPTVLPGRIVFVSDREGSSTIFAMRPDGIGQEPLLPLDPKAHDKAPAVSPDGQRLAFVSNRERQDTDDIFVASVGGSNVVKITSGKKIRNASPSWFPDGRRLAFTSNRNGGWEIFTMGDDGGSVRQVTKSREDIKTVRVSPDGRRFAYTCGEDICLVNPDGTDQRKLLHTEQRKDLFAWSPDGNMIVYTQSIPDSKATSLHIIDRAGRDREIVSNGTWPTWSPDGTKLVFASDTNGSLDLYLYDLQTGEVRRLTNTPSDEYAPVWTRF